MKNCRVTWAPLFLWLLSAGLLLGQSTQAERKAFDAIKLRAEKGDARAQLRLAEAYETGSGGTPDLVKAAKWHRRAAEQGLAEAQLRVGLDYAHGTGVKPDPYEEVRWFRKAAEQGLAEGQLNLGLCYMSGEGIAKDEVQAVHWFQKAADQNLAPAQYEIGKCCFEGKGLTKDIEEGLKWTRKSAEQGFALAEERLGECYVSGEGLAKDHIQAYKWFNLASAQGTEIADDTRVSLAKVATLMTTEQIAEAQRLAREFKPTISTNEPQSAASLAQTGGMQGVKPKEGAQAMADSQAGLVNIKADDDTLEIFVDGSFVGNPPTRLKLSAGPHVIELKKSGLKTYRKELSVIEGSELNLRPTLEKQ
jgi:TPR repeat protein